MDQDTERPHISMSLDLIQAGTYAWKVASFPNVGCANIQEVREIGHGSDCVEYEAKKMGIGAMGDTIDGPRAMVVHFWDTSDCVY